MKVHFSSKTIELSVEIMSIYLSDFIFPPLFINPYFYTNEKFAFR